MALKGGTTQACAACKYQRRKCASDCPLAPYFPPDQPKMFQNAHRLFGVSNIVKHLKQLEPNHRFSAMQSIIYQATVRDRYPVTGCLGLICHLEYYIRHTQEELRLVLSQLEICRHRQVHHHQLRMLSPSSDDSSSSSPLELGCSPLSLHHNPPPAPQQYDSVGGIHHYDPTANAPLNFDFLDPKDNSDLNPLWPQNSFGNIHNHDDDIQNPLTIQSQSQSQAGHDYDELHPFLATFDDRQSYVESKEAYDQSSSESSSKDTVQSVENVAENELKSAAACFSLISLG